MCRLITNCIQKIQTELGKKIIFGKNIRIRFRYIGCLDIFYVPTLQNQNYSDPEGPNSNPTYKFNNIQARPNFKIQKIDSERNNLYINKYPNVHT